MVGNITSLSNNGLRDWLIQRFSALVIAAYTIFMLGFFLTHSPMTYAVWQHLFACPLMKVANLLLLLSLLAHAWIGIWTVSTDYLTNTPVRLFMQLLVFLILLSCLIWGIEIFWRI